MSKRSFRIALGVVLGSVVLVVAIVGWLVHHALSYPDECRRGEHTCNPVAGKPGETVCECKVEGAGKEVEVEIKTGMSFPAIAKLLESKKLIEKPTWFRLFAMWEGATTNVKPGKYMIRDNLPPREVLRVIVAGVKEISVKVTLPEGKNMLEYFELIAKACPANQKEPCPHITTAKELDAVARDREFLSAHAITGDTVEGYLFPDTYEFRVGEKPRVVLEKLITRQQEVWQEILDKHGKDAAKLKDKLKWTDRDILTMASIVEKEAVEPAERPRIAQVFINRLTKDSFKPHRLETDPTIRYGCLVPQQKTAACSAWNEPCAKQNLPPGCDRLHRAQLDDKDNPYNTYQHEGLPPGPIASPGRRSIEATVSPDGFDYLYFVAKNEREHVFAKTFEEHKKNVDKYQK